MIRLIGIMLLSVLPAMGGSRVSFDSGWEFKYYGKGEPTAENECAEADGCEPGHEALKAVDGDRQTRWCAKDAKPGHYLTVTPPPRAKVSHVRILWENARPKQVKIVFDYGSKNKVVELSTKDDETLVDCGAKAFKSVKIIVNGTGKGNWASIREVEFLNNAGKVLPQAPIYPETQLKFDARGFKKVQLPHDWAIESKFLPEEPNETGKLPWVGYGWYRRVFTLPADFDAENERYYLDFDGVMSNPRVYVNGRKAGEWAYGYSPFRVDITPYLRGGKKNVVAVLVSNRPQSTRWYPGAGIYRHVWIEKTTPVHIDQWGVHVTTPEISEASARVVIKTTVRNTGTREARLELQQKIPTASAKPVKLTLAPGAEETVTQELSLSRPKLWSCDSPHLYCLETTLLQEGQPLDAKQTTFGVRHIEWKTDGFYLNGKRVQIKGVCEHHDLGPLGAAFHARAYERKIEILKGMGCNAIRMTHNPPAAEVLDLCDKHGMLVVNELFDIWKHRKYNKVNGYHIWWHDWWKLDVRNVLLRDRNHPCIIAWSGGNEVPEITHKEGVKISSDLRDEVRRYDTTRPYTVGTNAANGAHNGFADTQDVFGYNYKPSHYARFVSKRPNQPLYGSETASCVGTRDTYVFPLRWGVDGGYKGEGAVPFQVSAYGLSAPGWGYCPDAEFAAQDAVPQVAGEFVWTGFDYLGEPTPYNQDASIENNIKHLSEKERKALMREYRKMGNKAPSRSSYFGIIDLAGFPKDTYYLYKSRWAPQVAQAHLLPHWNWPGREGKVTPVMCFTSGDEAELFVNGKSQGIRRRGDGGHFSQGGMKIGKNAYRFVWEEVKYEPGELRVEVRKNGKKWARDTRVTTGAPAMVVASADHVELLGDGRDLSFIELAVTDAKGQVVPTDCRAVSFSIDGPAELVGFCNGNPLDHTCMQNPKQEFFNGRLLAVVRSTRKGEGKVNVTIRPKGLPDVVMELEVKAATAEQLKR